MSYILQWLKDEAMGVLYVIGGFIVIFTGAGIGELLTGQLFTKKKEEPNDPS